MNARGTIVVGVDRSDGSRTALEFSLEEAVRRGSAVRVVSALPEVVYWATSYRLSPELLNELSADVEKTARDVFDEVVRERGDALADVPVEVRVRGGTPRCSCRSPATRTCWWSGTAGEEGSAAPYSAR